MSVPADGDEAIEQMLRVVKGDFESWSGGAHLLSMRQVGELERKSAITGQQAATLGLVAQMMVHEIKSSYGREPKFSRDELIEKIRNNKNLPARYQAIMRELSSAVTADNELKLYGPTGAPAIEGIHQAGIGDCYALSSIEAVMNTYGPDYIKKMLRAYGNNTFTVKFPGAGAVTVKMTQTEIAQGNIDPGNGCWLQVLGIAIDRLRVEKHPHANRRVARRKNQEYAETAMGWLAHGGRQPVVLHWLTNHHYIAVKHKSSNWNRQTIGRLLAAATGANEPCGACTTGHCLSVVNWDGESQRLTVMNPWGTDVTYAPNGTKRFQMKNGQFSLSLEEFLAYFASLNIPASVTNR